MVQEFEHVNQDDVKEHMAKSAQAFLAKCFRRSDLPDEPPAVRIRPSAEELLRDDFVSSWVAD